MNPNQQFPYNNAGYTCNDPRNFTLPGSSLTPDQIEMLRKNKDEFKIEVNDIDVMRTKCNHRGNNGQSALYPVDNEYQCCSICGSKFKIVDLTPEYVKSSVEALNNIIHTIKCMWIDAPAETNQTLWQFQALLPNMEKIADHSINNFTKYEQAGYNVAGPNQTSPAYSGYYTMQNFLNNPNQFYAPQPMQGQQPMMGYQMPMQGQQPMMGYQMPNNQYMNNAGYQPQPMQPMMMGTNPVGYGYPDPNQHMAPNAGVMPPAAAAPQEAGEEIQQSKTYQI